MNNNQRLKEIRDQDRLSRRDIAQITLYSQSAVDYWLAEEGRETRAMPDKAMRLLELETGRRKAAWTPGKRRRVAQG